MVASGGIGRLEDLLLGLLDLHLHGVVEEPADALQRRDVSGEGASDNVLTEKRLQLVEDGLSEINLMLRLQEVELLSAP